MAKTDFLTADMTRRQFMKISGKSLAGLTLSASMLSLFGCSQKQVDAGAVATWALPQGLLVVNADLCTGCQRCEINCTLTNDGVCSSYISRVKIQRRLNLDGDGNGLLSGTDNCFVYFPDTCRQCEDPACGNACPQKAIITNEQGIRVVDTDKCIGCGACVEACPWHMPTVNPETGSPPSASPAVPAWRAARPALCPSWTGMPLPAQHRLLTRICKEEQQWLKPMAGQARSCAST